MPVLPATPTGKPANACAAVPADVVRDAAQAAADGLEHERVDVDLAPRLEPQLLRRRRRPGSSIVSARCGVTSVPPFAISAYSVAIWSGVTCTKPWPIEALTASPDVHLLLIGSLPNSSFLYSASGATPAASGMSRPVGAPKPRRRIHSGLRLAVAVRRGAVVEPLAERVEVRVARLRERRAQRDEGVRVGLEVLVPLAVDDQVLAAQDLVRRRSTRPDCDRRDRRHRLERRAGRVDAVGGAVEQRRALPVGLREQLREVRVASPCRRCGSCRSSATTPSRGRRRS